MNGPTKDAAESPHAGHVLRVVRQRLGPHVWAEQEARPREDRARTHRRMLLTLLEFLRRDRDTHLDMLTDMSAIDHGPVRPEGVARRFEVFFRLRSSRLPYRLWLSVDLPEDDPSFPSIVGIHQAAPWYERELHDLFGIDAEGHPDLRRLILYNDFMGHPARRDYPRHKGQSLVPLRSPQRPPEVFGDAPVVDPSLQTDTSEEGKA